MIVFLNSGNRRIGKLTDANCFAGGSDGRSLCSLPAPLDATGGVTHGTALPCVHCWAGSTRAEDQRKTNEETVSSDHRPHPEEICFSKNLRDCGVIHVYVPYPYLSITTLHSRKAVVTAPPPARNGEWQYLDAFLQSYPYSPLLSSLSFVLSLPSSINSILDHIISSYPTASYRSVWYRVVPCNTFTLGLR